MEYQKRIFCYFKLRIRYVEIVMQVSVEIVGFLIEDIVVSTMFLPLFNVKNQT